MKLRDMLWKTLSEVAGDAHRKASATARKAYAVIRGGATRRNAILAAAGITASLALGAAGYYAYRDMNHPRHNRNVFIVVSDAMRADKIGKIVNGMEVTPNLNRFAEDCVCFENAYASSTQTKTSVASMLSGQYPQYHGVLQPNRTLPDLPTLPSALLDQGYVVIGITANPVIRAEIAGGAQAPTCGYGYAFTKKNKRGCRLGQERGVYVYLQPRKEDIFYESKTERRGIRDTSSLFATFWGIVRRNEYIRHGHPFFVYIHDMRTHQPWLKSQPVEGITGKFHKEKGTREEIWQRDFEVIDKCLSRKGDEGLTAEERERVLAINDEAAFTFDACFGRFIERLKSEGIYKKATIVFTADHGDEFWEHGKLGHSQNLYNASLKVPFMIRHPGTAPKKIKAAVSNASIYETIMDLFGKEAAINTNVDSLKPYMTGEISGSENRLTLVAALGEDYEKIITPDGVEIIRLGDRYERYDTGSDPDEEKPLPVDERAKDEIAKQTALARNFAKTDGVKAAITNIPAMSFWVRLNPDGTFAAKDEKTEIPDEVKKQLKSLGYLQ